MSNKFLLVLFVLLSIFIFGLSIYNGWVSEIILFGRNIFISMIDNGTLKIPEHEGVTTVKYGEFAYKLFSRITIPDNITTIESKAFKGNKLTSITIGSNVSFGNDAFGNGFESVYNNNDKFAGTYTRHGHKSTEWIIWHDNFSYIKPGNTVTITGYN